MSSARQLPQLSERPSILITRLSAVGDCVHTVPLLNALRQRWPEAHLGWVTQPGPASLLRGHHCLDELIVAPRGWLSRPGVLGGVRAALQRTRWDLVVDPQGLTKSSLLGWLTGCPWRLGFQSPYGRELSCWLNTRCVAAERIHVVDRYLELLQPLGIVKPSVRFDLGPYPPALPRVEDILSRRQLCVGEFALVSPGAGWPSKWWPARRYGTLAKHLGQRHGLPTLVAWSGPDERLAAEEIVAAGGGEAILAPFTSLPELAELARRARLMIGGDTGPLHLAAAVGTPCIALFGPTDPAVCGPYGRHHICVQSYLQAQQGRRRADNLAMRAIQVDQVRDACDDLLARLQNRDTSAA